MNVFELMALSRFDESQYFSLRIICIIEEYIMSQINLYSVDGTLKYSSDCSADNGYFLLPVYDQVCCLIYAVL